jgi:hypothetical protein
MSQVVRLQIPDEIADRAREVAARTRQSWEDVLLDWLNHAAREVPVNALTDSEVLALADLQMSADEASELSELLGSNREGALDPGGTLRLEQLMAVYRNGMVRKAQAMQEAVARGLKPPLNRE